MFSPDTGKVEWSYDAPKSLETVIYEKEPELDDFNENQLPLYMVFWGTPENDFWKIEDSKLKLKCIPQTLEAELEPMRMDGNLSYDKFAAFVARRQRAFHVSVMAAMHFYPEKEECAGIAVVQAMNHQIHIERAIENEKQVVRVVLVTAEYNKPPYFPGFESKTSRKILKSASWNQEDIILKLDMKGEDFVVYYGENTEKLEELCRIDGALINPEKVGCMCGTLLGMFATGNETFCDREAEFDWFRYQEF